LLGQYLLPEWKLDVAENVNVVESALYYFLGMAAKWKKVYPGAVRIYFEMVHFFNLSHKLFFRAGMANPLYSFRLAL